MPFRIACIVGTRPEAIKMVPVVMAARERAHLKITLLATGQQDALFDDGIAGFGIVADVHLGVTAGAGVTDLRAGVARHLTTSRPDLVLVQGDTNTALAGAEAAVGCGIVLGHVEAGLRTHNPARPFPEENNRVAIGQLARLHFAPSGRAAANLKAEQVPGDIHVTGNPGIDALMSVLARLAPSPEHIARHILITCHRRENFGAPLMRICAAIRAVAGMTALPLLLPVHPNPNVGDVIRAELGGVPNISLVAPLDYAQMLAAIRASRFVLSDSGGLQEECAAMGVPLLCLREETERPELVASGTVRLVGSDTALIVSEAQRLLTDDAHHMAMALPSFPYGRGDAAEKIVTLIERFAEQNRR